MVPEMREDKRNPVGFPGQASRMRYVSAMQVVNRVRQTRETYYESPAILVANFEDRECVTHIGKKNNPCIDDVFFVCILSNDVDLKSSW